MKHHFFKSLCFDGLINVEYMATADVVADIFTKALLDGAFSKHAKRLLGIGNMVYGDDDKHPGTQTHWISRTKEPQFDIP